MFSNEDIQCMLEGFKCTGIKDLLFLSHKEPIEQCKPKHNLLVGGKTSS